MGETGGEMLSLVNPWAKGDPWVGYGEKERVLRRNDCEKRDVSRRIRLPCG
jgi:hypothetical protein